MKLKIFLLLLAMLAIRPLMAQDTYNQIDEMGNVTQRNQNFNKHNNDTTSILGMTIALNVRPKD